VNSSTTTKNVVGIDPGLKGGICILDEGCDPVFLDPEDVNLLQFYSDHLIAVEKQVAMPRQKGANKTAFEYGRLIGRLESYGLNLTIVRPQEWYKIYSIPAGMKYSDRKKVTAEKMIELYPKTEKQLYGPRGGLLDGRSDALAIAHWAKTTSP